MTAVIGVMLGGALGGMLRMWVGNRVTHYLGGRFPWGTLVINLSSALLLGAAFGVWSVQGSTPDTLGWSILTAGLLGGYSTVSSLSLQVLTLWQQRRMSAVCYLLASVTGGIVLVAAGHAVVQAMVAS
ncbi:fluoride efflux transporter FluC [Halomonas sp. LS-001]